MFLRQREGGTLSDVATGKILHFETSESIISQKDMGSQEIFFRTQRKLSPDRREVIS